MESDFCGRVFNLPVRSFRIPRFSITMPARKNLTGRPASSSAALSEMSNFLSRRAQQASQKKSSRKASAKKTLDAVLAALKPHLKAHRNSSSAVKASFAGVIKKFNSTRNGNTTAAARRKPALPPPAAARASRALLALARSASLFARSLAHRSPHRRFRPRAGAAQVPARRQWHRDQPRPRRRFVQDQGWRRLRAKQQSFRRSFAWRGARRSRQRETHMQQSVIRPRVP